MNSQAFPDSGTSEEQEPMSSANVYHRQTNAADRQDRGMKEETGSTVSEDREAVWPASIVSRLGAKELLIGV